MVESFVEAVKQGSAVDPLKLEVGQLDLVDASTDIVHFLIEFIQDLVRDDCLEAIYDSTLILFRLLLGIVAMHEGETSVETVAVGHVDETQELVAVVD